MASFLSLFFVRVAHPFNTNSPQLYIFIVHKQNREMMRAKHVLFNGEQSVVSTCGIYSNLIRTQYNHGERVFERIYYPARTLITIATQTTQIPIRHVTRLNEALQIVGALCSRFKHIYVSPGMRELNMFTDAQSLTCNRVSPLTCFPILRMWMRVYALHACVRIACRCVCVCFSPPLPRSNVRRGMVGVRGSGRRHY